MGNIETVLEATEICAAYGDVRVLAGVSLGVGRGEIVGIIGPNGAGKTTLLRVMAGLLAPSSGCVRLLGKDISRVPRREVAGSMAFMPQRLGFSEAHTVREIVSMGRYPHIGRLESPGPEEAAAVAKAMELAQVAAFSERTMGELSGGEVQRVFFAQVLAQEAGLLLMDEPTTHLDISHQVRILDLVRRLNRNPGLTVVMVLHDLNVAAEYCHRLVLLDGGRVRRCGTPDEVIDYGIIEEVYRTVVVVKKNPISSRPYVIIIPGEFTDSGVSPR